MPPACNRATTPPVRPSRCPYAVARACHRAEAVQPCPLVHALSHEAKKKSADATSHDRATTGPAREHHRSASHGRAATGPARERHWLALDSRAAIGPAQPRRRWPYTLRAPDRTGPKPSRHVDPHVHAAKQLRPRTSPAASHGPLPRHTPSSQRWPEAARRRLIPQTRRRALEGATTPSAPHRVGRASVPSRRWPPACPVLQPPPRGSPLRRCNDGDRARGIPKRPPSPLLTRPKWAEWARPKKSRGREMKKMKIQKSCKRALEIVKLR